MSDEFKKYTQEQIDRSIRIYYDTLADIVIEWYKNIPVANNIGCLNNNRVKDE
jgi:hypothetical protein